MGLGIGHGCFQNFGDVMRTIVMVDVIMVIMRTKIVVLMVTGKC